jgi:peptidoglycan/LPS O-acetylase OafA/YrhL
VAANYLLVTDVFSTKWPDVAHWSLVSLFHATVLWLGVFWVVRRLVLAYRLPRPHQRTVRILNGLAVAVAAVGGWYLVDARTLDGWQMPYVLTPAATGWLAYQLVVGAAGRWVAVYLAAVLFAAAALGGQYRLVAWVAASALFLLAVGRAGDTPLPRGLRWLGPLSRLSFSVYLTHGFTSQLVFGLGRVYAPAPGPGLAAGLLAGYLVATFVVAAVFHRVVERNSVALANWLRPRVRNHRPVPRPAEASPVLDVPPAWAAAAGTPGPGRPASPARSAA